MKRPSLIVDLAGPAGAGKTTISQELSKRSENIMIGVYPFIRGPVVSPFFVRQILLLMPTFLRLYKNKRNGRCFNQQEMAWMALLNGWHHILRRKGEKNGKVIVLDQGPVFMLAQLHVFGSESLRNRSLEKWWESVFSQWATALNMVVWLDASDTCLLERIRTRSQGHLVKDKSEIEVFKFLANYRVAYKQVISILMDNHSSPKVLRFDTTRENLDEIVNRLLVEFGLENGEGKVVC